jgi:hypothetical protein
MSAARLAPIGAVPDKSLKSDVVAAVERHSRFVALAREQET